MSKQYSAEVARNIRRCLKAMGGMLEVGNDRDSRLLDMVNHLDTLAEEIENNV